MKKFLLLALSMAFLFHANAINPNVSDGRDGGNHWTPDVAQFANSMTVIGVVQIDGVEQATADLEVGAFCNDVCRGTHKLAYYSAINRYLLFLDVFGEDGDLISFRLYDHGLGEELDVTCSNTLTFSTNGNHGNPMSPYVIDFEAATVSYTISASASPSNGGSVSGAGTYEEGQSCTLIATPSTGYSFVRWTKNGSQVSTSASYTFTVTENASYVAVFSLNSYTITASASPSAGGTVSGGGSYSHGSNCTLTATPNAGYTFLRWTKNGSQVSTSASYSFTVTETASYVAVFSQNSYTITASANPTEGGSVSGAGSYNYGETCSLTATPGTGYSFVRWTKNGSQVSTNATYSFTVTENASYVAVFSLNSYTITASANPSEGGSVSGGGSYSYGSTCSLTATPNTGYAFVNWTENGSAVSSDATMSFTVTGNRSLVANFTVSQSDCHWIPSDSQYANTMTAIGVIQINGVEQRTTDLELGAFCNDVCRGTHKLAYYSQVDRYLLFLDIYGDDGDVIDFRLYDHALGQELDVSCASTLTFATNANHGNPINPYIFDFESAVVSYTISASASPSNGGTVTGAGTYDEGQSCTLTATPNTGYTFVRWTKNGSQVSTNASYTFTVTENATYVAVFSQNSYTISVSANPSAGGSVSGGGIYTYGQSCTLTAIANDGYSFVNWMESETVVSSNASYTFTVTGNRSIVAVFSVSSAGTYVDLGLPSGTLWATCNIGADAPEQYGDHFAWGEIQPKNNYSWEEYQFCEGSENTLTKYCYDAEYGYNGYVDELTILLPEDDAATVYWGEDWRMPTREEWEELMNNTSATATVRNGVNGWLFTSENGNSLFLPSAGRRKDTGYYTGDLYYWSSTLNTHHAPKAAWFFYSSSGACHMGNWTYYRNYGQSVRAVRSSSNYLLSLSDDFNDGVIDPALWTYKGSNVYEADGLMKIEQNVTDDDVRLTTLPMMLTPSGQIVMERSFMVHKANNYFSGGFAINFNGLGDEESYIRVSYWHESYIGKYGTYVDASFDGQITETRLCDAVFDTWLTEKVIVDVETGMLTYYLNGALVASANIAGLASQQVSYYNIRFWPYSWWTGHYHYMDYINVNTDLDATYTITVSAEPSEGGTVSGGGVYQLGQSCSLSATVNEGYTFLYWSENGEEVSSDANYSFVVAENITLTAYFARICEIIPENIQVQVDLTSFTEATISWTSDHDLFDLEYSKVNMEGFENGIPESWVTIDADGDGRNWGLLSDWYGNYSGHNSLNCAVSQSYANGALHPDNYLVSPQYELGGVLMFWACAYNTSYAADHFGVAVSTGSQTNPDDFTTIQEWTMTAKGSGLPAGMPRGGDRAQGTWYLYSVDLSDYAGQLGYIAIRHFNCSDQWAIFVDDFQYDMPSDNVLVEGITNQTYTLSGLDDMSDYIIRVRSSCGDGETYSNWVETTFTNKHYVVNAMAEPEEGGEVFFGSFYDFEDDLQGWTTIDADDNTNLNWYHSGNSMSNSGYDYTGRGHNGSNGFAVSQSYIDYNGAYQADNYLVSPQMFALQDGSNITFWADYANESYPDHFGVYISTAATPTVSSFSMVWEGNAKDANGEQARARHTDSRYNNWRLHTVDLSAYAGQTVWIAFRHNDYDMYEIWIDDITIKMASATAAYLQGANCTVFGSPNPGYIFVNWTENGEEVSVDTVYTFAVTENHDLVANFIRPCTIDPENLQVQVNTENHVEANVSWDSNWELFELQYGKVFSDGITEGFENGIPEGWTTIDADGDGYTWIDKNNISQYTSYYHDPTVLDWYHSGSNAMVSCSYINGIGVLTPDNYLISPQLSLGSRASMSFWVGAVDPNYSADHLGVFVSTTGTNPEDFVMLQEWTLTAKSKGSSSSRASRDSKGMRMATWYNYTVDLSDYEGQQVYLAFRHFNCTDQFVMSIDDVEFNLGINEWIAITDITEPNYTLTGLEDMSDYVVRVRSSCGDGVAYSNWVEAIFTNKHYSIAAAADPEEGGTITGSGDYDYENTCVLTATPNEDYVFMYWTENGQQVSMKPSYSFSVTTDRNLVAHFELRPVDGVVALYDPDPNDDQSSSVKVYWSMNPLMNVGFEAGFGQYEWEFPDGYPWAVTDQDYHEGSYCMKSGNAGTSGSTSSALVTVAIPVNCQMEFFSKISSEKYYDKGKFYIDDQEMGSWSGDGNWEQHVFDVASGTHTFKWAFVKDLSIDSYDDCFYVDDISFVYSVRDDVAGTKKYSLYRASTDNLDAPELVVNGLSDTCYVDQGWAALDEGWYRYGVSVDYANNPNVATVILKAGDVWGDGTGYQLLLDADADAYGTLFPTYGPISNSCDVSEGLYDGFEYMIPTNADPVCTTENIVINNCIAIEIPAGTYDWCITNPVPNDRIWIAGGNSRYDNFEFEGGKVYEFYMKTTGTADRYELTITSKESRVVWSNKILKGFPHTVTVSADPYEGGTVSGEGVYVYESNCTVSAVANENYTFMYWTENGQQVSTESNYTFTVTGDRDLVAHFTLPSVKMVMAGYDPDPDNDQSNSVKVYWSMDTHFEPGWIYYDDGVKIDAVGTGGGQFFWGIMFPADTYSGNVLTKVSAYDHQAMTGKALVYQGGDTAPGTALDSLEVVFTGVGEFVEFVFENPVAIDPEQNLWVVFRNDSGAPHPAACSANTGDPNGRWVSTDGVSWIDLVSAGLNDTFMLRAFVVNVGKEEKCGFPDNANREEVLDYNVYRVGESETDSPELIADHVEETSYIDSNWSTLAEGWYRFGVSANYSTVESAIVWSAPIKRNAQSQFAEQLLNLSSGWNWWSSSLEMDATLDAALKDAIAAENTTAVIKNVGGNTMLENGTWSPVMALNNESMYMIRVDNAVTTTLTAAPADPANHPITLASGWNWIGFPTVNAMTLDEAFAGITPNEEDVVKGTAGPATYTTQYGWNGSLTGLEPGVGYMYKNNGDPMTLVYPSTSKGMVRVVPMERYWMSDTHRHATTLTMLATLDASRYTMTEGNYEIGAFVGDECRGSARLQRVGSQYIAYLSVSGEEGETVRFKLYDVTNNVEQGLAEEQVSYVSNAITGTTHEPVVLHFRGTTDVNESAYSVSMYPNPTKDEVMINGREIETVKVYNALGQLVYMEECGSADNVELHLNGLSAGVYTVNVRMANGQQVNKRIVKE